MPTTSEQTKLTEFSICDECGLELHKGEVVVVSKDSSGNKEYRCVSHDGELG